MKATLQLIAFTVMFEINPAVENQKNRLYDILRGTYLDTMAAIVPPEALEAFHRLDSPSDFVERCWQDFDVAIADNIIVGLLFVYQNKIESLHIHPDYSRQGHGAKLLSFGEEKISKFNSFAELEVLAANHSAREFYLAKGWFCVKTFIGLEVGDTPAEMILMRKDFVKH